MEFVQLNCKTGNPLYFSSNPQTTFIICSWIKRYESSIVHFKPSPPQLLKINTQKTPLKKLIKLITLYRPLHSFQQSYLCRCQKLSWSKNIPPGQTMSKCHGKVGVVSFTSLLYLLTFICLPPPFNYRHHHHHLDTFSLTQTH